MNIQNLNGKTFCFSGSLTLHLTLSSLENFPPKLLEMVEKLLNERNIQKILMNLYQLTKGKAQYARHKLRTDTRV